MSLQNLLTGANPFYLLALTLLLLFFLYLRRHRTTEAHDERTGHSHEAHEAHATRAAHDKAGDARREHDASHRTAAVATAGAVAAGAAGAALAANRQGHADTPREGGHHSTISASSGVAHAASQQTSAAAPAHGTIATATATATSDTGYELRVPGIDYAFTDDTLRRHNRLGTHTVGHGGLATAAATVAATAATAGAAAYSTHGARDGASAHTSAAAPSGHTTTHTTAGASHAPRDAITHDDVVVARGHVPDDYAYEEKRRSWVFPVVAALTAALVSCQVASDRGVLGSLADLFGGSRPAPVVAKIEAKVPSADELKAKAEAAKAKVEEAAATAKAKVANVAEKAIEAAKPEPKPAPPVEVKPAPKPEPKPAPVVVEAPLPPPVPGQTSYYGLTESVAGAPFNAAAKMNPDYNVAPPAAEPPKAVAVDVPAPAALPTTPGQTSYFGLATRPDSDQLWAAAATRNKDYSVAAAPTPAPAPAPVEAAPVSLGGNGQTSYFGIAAKPDSSFPWAAGATMNPNYKPAVVPVAAPAKPVTPEVIETCRDALNAEAQAGKINFATSSFEILPESYKTLDTIAKMAKDCGGVIIEVGGHTDSTGKPASNKTLSDLRAKAVVRYLTGAGVDADKLRAVGYGQDRPVASNATDAGKRQNRRIEFLVSAP